MNPRELAMQILLDVHENKAYSNLEINKYLKEDIDFRDENLIREMVYGVLENNIYLDYIISKASKLAFKKIHKKILEILRLGIYQILFMDRIPNRAAVDEAVKLAKKHGNRGSIGFVNGILREIVRNTDSYTKVETGDKIKDLSIKYSHPDFLVKEWVEDYGLEFTKNLIKANNKTPNLNIRVNSLKISRDELFKRLSQKGLEMSKGKLAKDCLIIHNPRRITELEEFKKGLFTIQDESSMLVGQLMNPKEGSRIIDISAAPGGKSTHLGQIMNNSGYILSRDIHKHKLRLIEENAKRLGITIIETEMYDGLNFDEKLKESFDYCLLDAPCSGFGIIRRKPEIKLNKGKKDISDLAKLQYKMLDRAKGYIKRGGALIYSTCTISQEENLGLIKEFLAKNKNFSLDKMDKIGEEEGLNNLDQGYIQLFPNIHGTDGFFIARLVKER